jgi:hypothetical protein
MIVSLAELVVLSLIVDWCFRKLTAPGLVGMLLLGVGETTSGVARAGWRLKLNFSLTVGRLSRRDIDPRRHPDNPLEDSRYNSAGCVSAETRLG